MDSVLEAAIALFEGDRTAADRWLTTPAWALGGVTPASLLGTPDGRQAVLDLIGQIEHGISP